MTVLCYNYRVYNRVTKLNLQMGAFIQSNSFEAQENKLKYKQHTNRQECCSVAL